MAHACICIVAIARTASAFAVEESLDEEKDFALGEKVVAMQSIAT